MKTYVLTLSKTFPKWHPRAGEPTYFKEKFEQAQAITKAGKFPCVLPYPDFIDPKYHTLRGNYERWEKIFEQIDQGEACLVLKQWSGVPYRSKQETIAVLTKEDGIGIQRLFFNADSDGQHVWWNFNIDGRYDVIERLAANDGLSLDDWKAWFKSCDLSKPLAIIHFTPFRY